MALEETEFDRFEDALDEAKTLHNAQSLRRKGGVLVWHAGGCILCRLTVDPNIHLPFYEVDFDSLGKLTP